MSSIRRLERVLNELGPARRSSRRISGKSILEVRSDKIPDSLLQAIIDGRWRTGITSVKGHFIRVDLPKDVAEEYNLGSYSYAFIEVFMGVRDDETISRVIIDVGEAYQTIYNNRKFSRNSVVGRLFGKIEKEIYRVIDTGRTKFDAFTNKSPRVVRRGRHWGSESRRRLRVSKGRRSLKEAIGDIPDYILDALAGRSWWEIGDYDSDHCIFLVDLDIETPVNPDDPETPVNPDARLDTYVVVDFDKRGKVTDIVTEIYVDDDYIYGEAYLQTRNKELLQRAQSEIDKMLREKEEYKRRRRPANLDRAP